jgi:hypothetical protein
MELPGHGRAQFHGQCIRCRSVRGLTVNGCLQRAKGKFQGEIAKLFTNKGLIRGKSMACELQRLGCPG